MSDELVQVRCNGCQRFFLTADALGMLCAIKGPCADCGGQFVLGSVVRTGDPIRDAAPSQVLG